MNLPPPGPLTVSLVVEQLWQPVPGGSGTYVRELVAALSSVDGVAPVGVRARGGHGHAGLPDDLPLFSSALPRPLLYEAWSRARLPRVPGPRPDVVHATTWAVPRRSAPLVVTVHDLAFRRAPEHFTPRGVRFFERALRVVRGEADVVVVPSHATAADCTAAGIEPDRVRVIPHGVRHDDVGPDRTRAFRSRHGLTRPYVFWCGAVEPRKNVATLLDAFARIVGQTDLDLVIAGPDGWGDAPRDVRNRLAELPAGRVHALGAVPWSELQEAYAAARVFCFPSLWEGFGMPVLEAQAHGVPVVTSRDTSMAEIGGEGVVLVDPTDADALAEALVVAHGERHDALAGAARANAAGYTWHRSAAAHVDAYRAAAGAAR
ncbi:glycosyltransferase family 1 protein [Isoptericola variabilis]|uniref:Glycosyl transferase group 1 n=1 Tax=Isoptericola variabilis (strain 225) TaxID=743718 RepID=F6FS21_ISOV2|nr:glycosyltransferase family 1 protein [Isoptericola variabilis]AEG45118.1 glycosyl transferase group 1 [Isoptericola variabilis 225]TWH32240.1 glycosyltransferase involved in cell wall biosynthesis [Isoptericola variabilis J7]